MEEQSNTECKVSFTVVIDPMAQPRIKARRMGRHANAPIQIYTPQNARVKEYKAAIAAAYIEAVGAEDAGHLANRDVFLSVSFVINRPQAMCSSKLPDTNINHNKKPDLDNMLKAVMDALNGVAWSDDSNVVRITSDKKYASIVLGGSSGRKRLSGPPSVSVSITYLKDEY